MNCDLEFVIIEQRFTISFLFSPTLLEQIIEQAQHYFMRIRTEQVLDTIAKQVHFIDSQYQE